MNLLQKRHGYSPAADGFAATLREMAEEFSPRLRSPGQIVYSGVSSTEGPGRSLRDARLQAVVLDFLPGEPLDEEAVSGLSRRPEDLAVPEEVMKGVSEILVNQYSCKPGQAEVMIKAVAGIRAWCCPKISELKGGQLVWLAHGTKKSRKTDPRLFVPVVLTLLTPQEQAQEAKHRGEFKRAKFARLNGLQQKPGAKMES